MTPTQVDVAVVGSVNIDLVASVARLPQPGETVSADDFAQFPGGKGSNQAVAAARLGRRVAFVGLIGDDAAAGEVRAALERVSVDVTHLQTEPGTPTGRALVVVDEAAENTIIVVGGANMRLTPAHVEAAGDVVRGARVVVAQLEIPVETVTAAARLSGGRFLLNPAPARELPAELMERVDVLVLNETEYEVVAGHPLPDDPADLGARLASSGWQCTVVVTLGARGCLVWDGGEVAHVPAPVVPVVDTTGAGDTFIGALADALSRDEPPLTAARWAVHAASKSVGALGATTAMPDRAAVLAAMASAADGASAEPEGSLPSEEAPAEQR
ncbi:ribokinase [Modestobacter marinus]|uniref:ribokinase n=1 Tax=Modestobacter marinus TaxID=477641 RepID=UPI0021BC0DCF|nr:ribokinase [Modestobacter marinus]